MRGLPPLIRGLTAALPDVALAAFILAVWRDPLGHGDGMVGNLLLLMLLEFIIIHASGFMGSILYGRESRLRKVLLLIGLGLIESIFVAGFCFSFGAWWPLASYWGLTLNRMLVVFLGPAPDANAGLYLGSNWAMSVVFYLGGTFLTILAPVPRLGVTEVIQPQLGLTGGGIWIDEPHRLLAFGTVYFLLQGLWNLTRPFQVGDRKKSLLTP